MPNSDRSLIVAAIFGLVSIAFGAGLALGGDWTDRPYEHTGKPYASVQRYRAEQRDANFAAYPFVESNRCYHAKNHDSADLCAQWRAAIAAERAANSATWANRLGLISVLVSALGFIVLLRSLKQTDRALEDSRRSANYAGESHFAFMRVEDAYLILSFHSGTLSWDGKVHQIIFTVEVMNIGRSAAVVQSIGTSGGGVVTVDGVPIPADHKNVIFTHRMVIRNLSGAGQTFFGTVYYHTAIGGAQSYNFTGTTMIEPDNPSEFYVTVTKRELPPRLQE